MSGRRSVRAARHAGRIRRARSLTWPVTAAIVACGPPAAEVEAPGIATVVVTQWNDSTELFLEYPELVAGRKTGNWAIHLTDMSDFQPIRTGTLTVRFTPIDGGGEQTFTLDAPARDGIFLMDPAVERPGTYSVTLDLSSPQAHTTHVLPEVVVHGSLEEAPREAEEEEGGGIAFLKEQQWVIPFAWSRPPSATSSAPCALRPRSRHRTAPSSR
jgi:membrane fusion protein, heavy metal efflux system